MTSIFAEHALLTSGWVQNLRLQIEDGRIAHLTRDTTAQTGDYVVDTVLPAMANLHSHSFQRAMAGMTEKRQAGQDSFWTWRDLMYRFTAHLNPDHVQAIAALVFMEMQEAGYASVGEFHYLHHQPDSTPYTRIDELSARIMAAANSTGIGLTHLPVLYSYSDVRQNPLEPRQRRFGNDVDRFLTLVGRIRDTMPNMPGDYALGIAPHSLRATSPDELQAVLAACDAGPIHIHIAEQPKEVQEVSDVLGARPVEWLLGNAPVDGRWCLIHATHMTDAETRRLAASGAVAGLCPITEANLGDGAFNGAAYHNAQGAFGVGSDSNIMISLTGELRLLEYSQRLRDLSRNVLCTPDGFTGHTLYCAAARGGAQAIGRHAGTIQEGMFADLVAIDTQTPTLCCLKPEQFLDGLIFAGTDDVVTDLWSAGRHQVRNGRHIARDSIIAAYRTAMNSVLSEV